MAQVGIVMGSDSDMPVMSKAAQMLDEFGISYEMTIISAHREPELIDAEEFIAKKGIAAKGKKCHSWDLKKVEFAEPLVKPEDLEEEKPEA